MNKQILIRGRCRHLQNRLPGCFFCFFCFFFFFFLEKKSVFKTISFKKNVCNLRKRNGIEEEQTTQCSGRNGITSTVLFKVPLYVWFLMGMGRRHDAIIRKCLIKDKWS